MCFSLQRRAIFHVFSQQPPPHPPLYRGYFSTQPTHKSLKNTAFRGFPNISRPWIFFLLTFAQLTLLLTLLLFSAFSIFWLCFSVLLFQLSILSEVRLLNFLRKGNTSSKGPFSIAMLDYRSVPSILLMAEILHHRGCMKPYKSWDKLPINWCRISAINSIPLLMHVWVDDVPCPQKYVIVPWRVSQLPMEKKP